MAIDIIYCAAGNRRFAEIAIEAGMMYGAQLPGTIYPDVAPLHFADQDWKKPDRERYVAAVAQHRPRVATVLDWEREEQLPEVLDWAEDIAPFVERVIIIPKVIGGIPRIPARVGGADVVLGYSVPTKYGGTNVPVWEFAARLVHLLGGSPLAQIHAAHYLNVISADGNYINLKATKFCEWWNGRGWTPIHPPRIDAPYEAFRRSCVNVMAAWRELQESPAPYPAAGNSAHRRGRGTKR